MTPDEKLSAREAQCATQEAKLTAREIAVTAREQAYSQLPPKQDFVHETALHATETRQNAKEQDLLTRDQQLSARITEWQAFKTALDAREQALDQRESDVATREANATVRESAVGVRETAADAKSQELSAGHASLSADQSDHAQAKDFFATWRQHEQTVWDAQRTAQAAELSTREQSLQKWAEELRAKEALYDTTPQQTVAIKASLDERERWLNERDASISARENAEGGLRDREKTLTEVALKQRERGLQLDRDEARFKAVVEEVKPRINEKLKELGMPEIAFP